MKNKGNLLVEVNRIREMMGLTLITEQGIGTLTKKLLTSLGFTDDATEAVAKNMNVSGKNMDTFMKSGLDDLTTAAKAKGIDIATATDAQIFKLIDDNPLIKSQIESLYRKATKEVTDELIKKIGLVSPDITNLITTATALRLHPSLAERAVNVYDSLGTKLDDLISQNQAKGTQIPELQELRNLVTLKQLEAEEMVNFKGIVDTGTEAAAKAATSDSIDDVFDKILNNNELGNITDANSGLKFLDRKLTELETARLINLDKTDRDTLLNLATENLDEALKNIDAFEVKWKSLGVTDRVAIFNNIKIAIDKAVKNTKDPGVKKNLEKANNWLTSGWKFLIKEKKSPINVLKGWVWFGTIAAIYGCVAKPGINILRTKEIDVTNLKPGIIECIGATLAGPLGVIYYLFRDGGAAILDGLDVGQYSNDAEGWADWVNDNKTNLNIVDFGYDTDEQKRYITNSAEDLIFVNYDPKSETFVPED